MTENQGGSCEPCKRKKCKCDRQLPSCGQCETSKLTCTYGESTKRGIPTGYLGLLEQRLGETEVLLYRALSELRAIRIHQSNYAGVLGTIDIPDPITRESNAPKPVRMEEWKEYPLKNEEEVERWRLFMGGGREASIGYDDGLSSEHTQMDHPEYNNPPNQYPNSDPSIAYHDQDMDFNVAAGLMGLSQSHGGQNQPRPQNPNNHPQGPPPPPTQITAILNPGFRSPTPPGPYTTTHTSHPSNYTADFNPSQGLHIHQGMSDQSPDLNQNAHPNPMVLGQPGSGEWETSPSATTSSGATVGQNAGAQQRSMELLRSQQLSAAFRNIYY